MSVPAASTALRYFTLPCYRYINHTWSIVNTTSTSTSTSTTSSIKQSITNFFTRPKTPPVEEKHVTNAAPTRLTIMTYNVWFDQFARQERHKLLIQEIEKYAPDVIGLQEVIPETIKQLISHEYIQKHYYVSDVTGATIRGYGVMLLTRYPMLSLRQFPFESGMARCLLMTTIDVGGQQLSIGTVHLESLNSAKLRAQQLQLCSHVMSSLPETCILMGDFNFDDLQNYGGGTNNLENDKMKEILSQWIDGWAHLHPTERGVTFTPKLNPMLKDYHETARYDRIMIKPASSAGWTAHDIHIIGTEPVCVMDGPYKGSRIVPSDHFGLVMHLEPTTSSTSSTSISTSTSTSSSPSTATS